MEKKFNSIVSHVLSKDIAHLPKVSLSIRWPDSAGVVMLMFLCITFCHLKLLFEVEDKIRIAG